MKKSYTHIFKRINKKIYFLNSRKSVSSLITSLYRDKDIFINTCVTVFCSRETSLAN